MTAMITMPTTATTFSPSVKALRAVSSSDWAWAAGSLAAAETASASVCRASATECGHAGLVDRAADAAEQGESEGRAEKVTGLRHRRRRACLLGRGRPDDQAGAEHEHRRDAQRHQRHAQ